MKKVVSRVHRYLIPSEENDHRPHILRPKAVMFVCLVALIFQSLFLFSVSVVPQSRLFGMIVVNTLIDGTNRARTADKLPALHESPLLDAAAREKANDMVAHDYFAHTSPAGLSPWYWFGQVGYDFSQAGENLAVDFSDSQDVTNAWLASPEHRANILNNGFSDIGMAYAQGDFNGHPAIYIVELFGTPAKAIALAPGAGVAGSAKAHPVKKPTAKPSIVVQPPAAVALTASSDQIFVAVKGASIGTVPETSTIASVAGSTSVSAGLNTNMIQRAFADPRRTVDYIYFVIALIFTLALLVNVFVKIRIQHSQVILGGMLVILVAGLLIVLNQHLGATGVVIL